MRFAYVWNRYLQANDQQQKERPIGEFDGHASDAFPSAPDDEPFAQFGTVHQSAGSPAGNA